MAEKSSRWSVSRAAILIAGLTAVSTLLGFFRDVVIAAVFGAGPELDAYLVALGLMNIVLGMVAGAMAKSVIPVTARESAEEPDQRSGEESHEGVRRSWHTHRGFDVALSVTMVVLGLVGVVMWIFVAPVTSILAPGFTGVEAETTQALTRIVLLATVLVAGTNLLASLAQSHGHFFWSSLQGVPFNIVMILAAALLGPQYGVSVLAVAFVVGSAARLILQIPPLRAVRARVRPSLRLNDPGFREIIRLAPALLVGSAIGNVNTLVDRAVGSTLSEGTITALSYGWRLVSLPETLIIGSLLIPLFAAMGASGRDRTEVRRLADRGFAVTFTVLTPFCLVLAVCAVPLVDVAFGYGAFDADDQSATALAVLCYAPALLALGCREMIVRASYSIGDAKSPVVVAAIAMVLNVVGDLVLAPIYGLAGIALATTASLLFAAIANCVILSRRHSSLDGGAAVRILLRGLIIAVIAGGGGVGARELLVLADLPSIVVGGLAALVIGGLYAAGLAVTRAPERLLAAEVVATLLRRPGARAR